MIRSLSSLSSQRGKDFLTLSAPNVARRSSLMTAMEHGSPFAVRLRTACHRAWWLSLRHDTLASSGSTSFASLGLSCITKEQTNSPSSSVYNSAVVRSYALRSGSSASFILVQVRISAFPSTMSTQKLKTDQYQIRLAHQLRAQLEEEMRKDGDSSLAT